MSLHQGEEVGTFDEWKQVVESVYKALQPGDKIFELTLVHEGPLLKKLTPRQVDILKQIVLGKSNKEIARSLGISIATVRIHIANLYARFKVHKRVTCALIGQSLLSELDILGTDTIASVKEEPEENS